MKRGKRICSELKAVRRRIADENGIELHQDECKHTGDCLGTCPKCEAEVRYLEQALTRCITTGRAAKVAGLTLSLAACGGTAESTLTVDTPLNVLPADTTCGSDSLMNPETDVPCPGIPIPGEEITLGIAIDTPDTSAITQDDEWMGLIEEEYPSFPGGEEALYDFISKNLQYPEAACEAHITGTVVVVFAVEKDGTIGNVRILRDLGYGCGEEAVRVVKMMPKWTPGKQGGTTVRTEFSLPIKFFPDQDHN